MGKLALLAGAAAGVTAATRASSARQHRADENRWLAVTVNRPFDEVDPAGLPAPLVELGDRIETRVRPASGDKGTELAARLREPGPSGVVARVAGQDPRQDVRSALRAAKSLLETGDVLRPDPPSTHPGPGGRLVELASRRAGGEGRL
ncbi:hypothetical protein [Actinophytocola sp.]|uniref:hypothetical protein n=1 Tax=Actinophytocola sp. TaxID=1872138 RepID=UPI003899E572